MYYHKQVPLMWYLLWLIGQAVKTPPSHGGNRGSIPLSAALFNRIAQPKDVETKWFWHFYFAYSTLSLFTVSLFAETLLMGGISTGSQIFT